MSERKIYPRTNDYQTVYLNRVITNPNICVGEYTIYNDFVSDPVQFEKNNVLYHYPINNDSLMIGKFCSIACGAKFIFTCANHTMNSLSTYTFPLFYEEWSLDKRCVTAAWDNKGDIVIGNDVWIGLLKRYSVRCRSFKMVRSINFSKKVNRKGALRYYEALLSYGLS